MLIEINKIKVSDRIRKDYGNIEELANDIKENGLINPPVVTPENELIAGERRLRALQFLDYKQIEVRVMTVKDALHQLKLEISENENRKDFSFSEKMQWAEELKKEYEKIAKVNQQGGQGGVLLSTVSDEASFRTDVAIAQDLDMGKTTYRQAEYIKNNAPEELIKQLDDGQLSINKAYTTLKEQNKQLQSELQQEKSKEPVTVEVDKTDYTAIEKLRQDLKYTQDLFDNKKQRVEILEKKIKIQEENSTKYIELKTQIECLTKEKDEIGRQIEATTELSGYIVEIRNFLKTKLAPIHYSQSLLDVKDQPIVIKNVTEIIECVEKWCQETRKYLPKEQQNIINVEVK